MSNLTWQDRPGPTGGGLGIDVPRRFPGIILSETDMEQVLRRAVESASFDFSGAHLYSEGAFYLAGAVMANNLFSFLNFNIGYCKLSLEGFESLLEVAAECKQLETFIVRENTLPKEAGLAISKLLGARGYLKELDLRDNHLGDIGVASIGGAFTTDLSDLRRTASISLLTLTVLDLSGNDLSDMAVLALCRGLMEMSDHTRVIERSPALKVLRLHRNRIGDKGALCLAQLLNNSTNHNHVGQVSSPGTMTPRDTARSYNSMASLSLSASPMIYPQVSKTPSRLSTASTSNAGVNLNLEEIGLNDNLIGHRGVMALLGFSMTGRVASSDNLTAASAGFGSSNDSVASGGGASDYGSTSTGGVLGGHGNLAVAQRVASSLRTLSVGRCRLTLDTLDVVAVNLSASTSMLEVIEMQFSEQSARDAVRDAEQRNYHAAMNSRTNRPGSAELVSTPSTSRTLPRFDSAYSSSGSILRPPSPPPATLPEPGYGRLSTTMQKLAAAVMANRNITALHLGALPEVIRQSCMRAWERSNMALYYDTFGALEAMESIQTVLGLSSDIIVWMDTNLLMRKSAKTMPKGDSSARNSPSKGRGNARDDGHNSSAPTTPKRGRDNNVHFFPTDGEDASSQRPGMPTPSQDPPRLLPRDSRGGVLSSSSPLALSAASRAIAEASLAHSNAQIANAARTSNSNPGSPTSANDAKKVLAFPLAEIAAMDPRSPLLSRSDYPQNNLNLRQSGYDSPQTSELDGLYVDSLGDRGRGHRGGFNSVSDSPVTDSVGHRYGHAAAVDGSDRIVAENNDWMAKWLQDEQKRQILAKHGVQIHADGTIEHISPPRDPERDRDHDSVSEGGSRGGDGGRDDDRSVSFGHPLTRDLDSLAYSFSRDYQGSPAESLLGESSFQRLSRSAVREYSRSRGRSHSRSPGPEEPSDNVRKPLTTMTTAVGAQGKSSYCPAELERHDVDENGQPKKQHKKTLFSVLANEIERLLKPAGVQADRNGIADSEPPPSLYLPTPDAATSMITAASMVPIVPLPGFPPGMPISTNGHSSSGMMMINASGSPVSTHTPNGTLAASADLRRGSLYTDAIPTPKSTQEPTPGPFSPSASHSYSAKDVLNAFPNSASNTALAAAQWNQLLGYDNHAPSPEVLSTPSAAAAAAAAEGSSLPSGIAPPSVAPVLSYGHAPADPPTVPHTFIASAAPAGVNPQISSGSGLIVPPLTDPRHLNEGTLGDGNKVEAAALASHLIDALAEGGRNARESLERHMMENTDAGLSENKDTSRSHDRERDAIVSSVTEAVGDALEIVQESWIRALSPVLSAIQSQASASPERTATTTDSAAGLKSSGDAEKSGVSAAAAPSGESPTELDIMTADLLNYKTDKLSFSELLDKVVSEMTTSVAGLAQKYQPSVPDECDKEKEGERGRKTSPLDSDEQKGHAVELYGSHEESKATEPPSTGELQPQPAPSKSAAGGDVGKLVLPDVSFGLLPASTTFSNEANNNDEKSAYMSPPTDTPRFIADGGTEEHKSQQLPAEQPVNKALLALMEDRLDRLETVLLNVLQAAQPSPEVDPYSRSLLSRSVSSASIPSTAATRSRSPSFGSSTGGFSANSGLHRRPNGMLGDGIETHAPAMFTESVPSVTGSSSLLKPRPTLPTLSDAAMASLSLGIPDEHSPSSSNFSPRSLLESLRAGSLGGGLALPDPPSASGEKNSQMQTPLAPPSQAPLLPGSSSSIDAAFHKEFALSPGAALESLLPLIGLPDSSAAAGAGGVPAPAVGPVALDPEAAYVVELSDRIAALENAIEFEHESSIHVLDTLLSQHYKLSQQQKEHLHLLFNQKHQQAQPPDPSSMPQGDDYEHGDRNGVDATGSYYDDDNHSSGRVPPRERVPGSPPRSVASSSQRGTDMAVYDIEPDYESLIHSHSGGGSSSHGYSQGGGKSGTASRGGGGGPSRNRSNSLRNSRNSSTGSGGERERGIGKRRDAPAEGNYTDPRYPSEDEEHPYEPYFTEVPRYDDDDSEWQGQYPGAGGYYAPDLRDAEAYPYQDDPYIHNIQDDIVYADNGDAVEELYDDAGDYPDDEVVDEEEELRRQLEEEEAAAALEREERARQEELERQRREEKRRRSDPNFGMKEFTGTPYFTATTARAVLSAYRNANGSSNSSTGTGGKPIGRKGNDVATPLLPLPSSTPRTDPLSASVPPKSARSNGGGGKSGGNMQSATTTGTTVSPRATSPSYKNKPPPPIITDFGNNNDTSNQKKSSNAIGNNNAINNQHHSRPIQQESGGLKSAGRSASRGRRR